LRSEWRLRARCPRGFLDHRQIAGSQSVHDAIERLEYGSHLGEDGVVLRRRETNSLARVAGVLSLRQSQIRCRQRSISNCHKGQHNEGGKTEDKFWLSVHARTDERTPWAVVSIRGRLRPPPDWCYAFLVVVPISSVLRGSPADLPDHTGPRHLHERTIRRAPELRIRSGLAAVTPCPVIHEVRAVAGPELQIHGAVDPATLG